MRITAGTLRGKHIESRPGQSLRPTTSMVREAIFNLLKHGKFLKDETFIRDDNPDLVEGRRVVDIFCGTGALGFEALSRGAEHVILIDQNPQIQALAKQNMQNLGLADKMTFIRSDSTQLPKARIACHLAFIDPPYRSGLAIPALHSLANQGWLAPGAVAVVEQSKKEPSLAPPKGFRIIDERVYSITRVTLLQYQ